MVICLTLFAIAGKFDKEKNEWPVVAEKSDITSFWLIQSHRRRGRLPHDRPLFFLGPFSQPEIPISFFFPSSALSSMTLPLASSRRCLQRESQDLPRIDLTLT